MVLAASISCACIASAQAQITYTINKEWARIWINKDGSIDLQYNITMTYLSGSPEGIVTVGMPKSGFQVLNATDLTGASLQFSDVSQNGDYAVDVYLRNRPPPPNVPNTFIVYAVVPGMIYPDTTNPGNVGMLFYPTTFSTATGSLNDLRVAIILPEGVNSTEVKYPAGTPFNSISLYATNQIQVYWNRTNWSPSQTFNVGVSFPEKYVSLPPSGIGIDLAGVLPFFIVIVVIGIAGAAVLLTRKSAYVKPQISVEALGAMRSLTAVEAGVVLGLKPVRVLTMVLFGLLLKRKITVTATDPLIKLQKLEEPTDQAITAPRYYEIDYLRAIGPDGTLNETMLARTYLGLTDTVNKKLRGYSREDTVNYYRSVVNQAWTQVTRAGTPELKGDAIDKNIEWLLADDKFDQQFKNALPPDVVIAPLPGWWWYWGIPHPSPRQPGQQHVPPTIPTEAKPIPGQDFANNVVRSLEATSNNIVKNVQDFTNKLIPAQAAAAAPSDRSVRGRSGCVCACAACACACACVSCACACAGGGAR